MMLRAEDIANISERLTGEQLEFSVEKHHSLVAFTSSYAIKVRPAHEVSRDVITRENAWLTREGLRPRLSDTAYGGELYVALIMDRLSSFDCVAYRLVRGELDHGAAAAVVRHLRDHTWDDSPRLLPRQVLASHLLKNFDRQVANGVQFVRTRVWRAAVESALMLWSNEPREQCTIAAHRNAFSPNIILDAVRGIVLIDPRSRTDSFSELPWFGDAATFAVDLTIHSWALDDMASLGQMDRNSDTWCGFLAVMLIKLLVRYRFCRDELGRQKEDWRERQDMLVVSRAAAIADEIAGVIEELSIGRSNV
jgi:hypothetical protein